MFSWLLLGNYSNVINGYVLNVASKKAHDPFTRVRKQIRDLIAKEYRTVEKFAYSNDLSKSTLSRFLNGSRKSYDAVSLSKIARALGKKLVIRLE